MTIFNRNTYIIKEHVGFMKLAGAYDLLDPNGQQVGIAREELPGIVKLLRLMVDKEWLPSTVNVYEAEGQPPVLSIHRPVRLIGTRVHVSAGGQPIGYFRKKRFTIGSSFRIFDTSDREIGLVKGDWKGWNFQLLGPNNEELGRVTKQWAGFGKELFTTADTYAISLAPAATGRREVAQLLLAAGLAIDTVFKEKDD
jgi:uncharacterized protein YxjI